MKQSSSKGVISSLLLLTGILICSKVSSESPTLRSTFGSFCNKTVLCNSREFLKCLNETCQCLNSEIMKHDLEVNSCVTLAGESCRHIVFSNSTNEDQKSWTEDVKCLTNAKCNTEGICECESHFYEMPNGSCQPKGLYGFQCKLDGQCREDLHYKCVDGTCNCRSENSKYNIKTQICVGLAGESCLGSYQSCVSNAHCDQTNSYRRWGDPNSIVYDCVCDPNTELSPEGLCLIPYQGFCDDSYPDSNCFPGLKCQDGRCVCPYEDYQSYDPTFKRCNTLVGGPCGNSYANLSFASKSFWEAPCVAHSSCTSAHSNQVSECKCDPGFTKTMDEACELQFEFGQACSTGSGSCAKQQGLFCTNGKCACKDGLSLYDVESLECRGLVGSKCSPSPPDLDQFWLTCVNGSVCIVTKPLKYGKGICRCKEGFALDGITRTCNEIKVEVV